MMTIVFWLSMNMGPSPRDQGQAGDLGGGESMQVIANGC